jgi:hypothetical protein
MKKSIKTQISKSKVSLTLIVFAIISMFSIGCTPTTPPTPACSTINTLFHQIYTATAAISGNVDVVTYDSEVHEYSFTLSANKTVCSVGYQSQPAIATAAIPYTIVLKDNTTSTTVFTISNTFSSTTTSYVSIASTPTLIAGHSYTLKRILTSYAGNIGNTIGRMVKSSSTSSITFPYSVGVMTITGSNFYQNAGTATNLGIPFIDIVFQ